MKCSVTSAGKFAVLLSGLFILHNCASPAGNEEKSNTVERAKTYEVYIVEIKQLKFQPAELKVHTNDTVLFVNRDIVNHDVTDSAGTWNSSALKTDEYYKMVITKNENYFCALHPVMRGAIVIE